MEVWMKPAWMGSLMWLLVWSVGCGNVDSSRAIDARADVLQDAMPVCDPVKPFSTPMPVMGVNSAANEGEATLSADERTIYFASTRSPGAADNIELYSATRATTATGFGAASLLAVLNSSVNDENPSLTSDGLTLFFTSNRGAGGLAYDLYIATRTTPAADFGVPATVAGVNVATALDGAPYINGNGTVLYFTSDRGGTRDIFRTTRTASTAAFGPPALVGELSSPTALDEGPVVTDDELTMYFGSDRPGGAGGLDIWVAHRTTTNDGFGAPTPDASLSSASSDFPLWISADGCRFLLSSNRPSLNGNGYDLYMASRFP
jgi:hypothetical protein